MTTTGADSSDSAAFDWTLDVPLLTNRFILYDTVKLLAWTAAIMMVILGSVFLIGGEFDAIPPMMLMALVTTGILGVVLLFVMLVVFMNRFRMRMRVAESGVSASSESRVGKAGNRIAIILGILAGRPGVAGAGMLGAASERVSLRWDEVHRIHAYPGPRVISVMNSWRVVLRLYCTTENYEAVASWVHAHAEAGRERRVAREAREAAKPKPPSQLGRKLGLTVLTLLGVFGVVATPFDFDGRLLAACAALTLLRVWLPFGRVPLALLGLCATLAIVGLIGAEGARVRHLIPPEVLNGAPEPAWSRYTGWSRLETGEWWRLALTAAGLLVVAAVDVTAVWPPNRGARKLD